jgi:hypothetical protein
MGLADPQACGEDPPQEIPRLPIGVPESVYYI